MFTLVIDGRAIAVTDAPEAEATELLESVADELIDLESEGEAIWDGESPITIRPATDEESAAFKAEADDEGDDEPVILFLIDVDGLEDELDEDEVEEEEEDDDETRTDR